MKRLILALAMIGALTLAFVGGRSVGTSSVATRSEPSSASSSKLYQCSMHPQIVSHEPGKCPICGMALEEVEESAPSAPAGERKILFYRHPMRPDVTSPTPNKDEMGMDYVPVYADDGATGSSDVAGHAPFTLSSERQQLIGVRRGRVETKDLARVIRTVGTVAYDPDLYRAIVEYRQAWGPAAAQGLAGASILRLRQMGLTDDLIKTLSQPSHDPQSLLLPGKEVWVYAQIFEYEVDLVHPGQPVTVIVPSSPRRTYSAEVAAVDSVLNPATRTARARILVATPDRILRPETFVHVTIDVPLGRKLAVPAEAVLDTGDHQTVFVVEGAGRFEPRSVELGVRAGHDFEVVSGLEEGEEVVTSANFLIDSESRFRSAVEAFTRAQSADGSR